MTDELLTDLLTVGLVDIGDSDDRYKHLDAAASKLATSLAENQQSLAPMVLVALDADADPSERAFELAERTLLEQWRLLRQFFKERPTTLLRILILAAVDRAAISDARACSIAALTAVSAVPYFVEGKELGVVERAVRRWVASAEAAAVEQWKARATLAGNVDFGLSAVPSVDVPKFASQTFLASVERAAGPQNKDGKAQPNPNPNWTNSAGPWSHEFAPRMADALADVANKVSATVSDRIEASVAEGLKSSLGKISSNLEKLVGELRTVHAAANLRNELIWWERSLYSPAVHCSYRELNPAIAALLMAHDLLQIVQLPNPGSVHYFFREAVSRLSPDDTTHTFARWCAEINAHGRKVREFFAPTAIASERVPLGLVLRKALHEPVSPDELRSKCGIDGARHIALADLAAWFLRDQEAERLVAEAPRPAKRPSAAKTRG